jgi:hypothetical protein
MLGHLLRETIYFIMSLEASQTDDFKIIFGTTYMHVTN